MLLILCTQGWIPFRQGWPTFKEQNDWIRGQKVKNRQNRVVMPSGCICRWFKCKVQKIIKDHLPVNLATVRRLSKVFVALNEWSTPWVNTEAYPGWTCSIFYCFIIPSTHKQWKYQYPINNISKILKLRFSLYK